MGRANHQHGTQPPNATQTNMDFADYMNSLAYGCLGDPGKRDILCQNGCC